MPINFNGSRATHINRPLSNFSIGYHPTGMVAEEIFNVIPVAHESDDYVVWDKGQAFRVERADGQGTLTADGTPSLTEDFGASLQSYRAEAYKRKTRITDRQRANQDDVFQLEVSKVRRVQDKILLDQELRVASILLATGNYPAGSTTTLSGTAQWNNASFASQTNGTFSVIEQNFDAGREAIRLATGGKEANVCIIPSAVARVMKRDVGVRDSIKYTHGDILTNGTLPDTLWGLKIISPSAVYTTSVEGEVPTMTDVWGKNVIIAYVDPNAGLDSLTLGKIFRARPFQVRQWRDEEIEATYYEPSVLQSEKLISGDCGYLIQNAIA